MHLTPRETQVLSFWACGVKANDIAGRLGIATKTVNHHREKIYRKLRINCPAQAAHYALAKGICKNMFACLALLCALPLLAAPAVLTFSNTPACFVVQGSVNLSNWTAQTRVSHTRGFESFTYVVPPLDSNAYWRLVPTNCCW